MPEETKILTCSQCGATADIATDHHAWDGWLIAGDLKCPKCNHTYVELLAKERARQQRLEAMKARTLCSI